MRSDDKAAFETTLAALDLPSRPLTALDATISAHDLDATLSVGRAAPVPLEDSLRMLTLGLPDSELEIPSRMLEDAELQIVSLLGKGGMGAVYLAKERVLNREVAIKTTLASANREASAALCAEGVITGSLEHPGIVPIHQLAKASDGRPVLVMKRIEGTAWSTLLADTEHPAWTRLGTIDDRRAFHVDILARVCDALAFAHSRGVIHRDIKPENVMVGEYGEVYLVDWGLAIREGGQPTKRGLVGTPRYMAPEMVAGEIVDARTDVYLVGATLHEILTGEPPHSGDTLHRVLLAALQSAPKTYSAETPADLADIATRAMAREPDGRYPTIRHVRDALGAHARNRASQTLSERANQILSGELEPMLRTATKDFSIIYRALAECRFALREARREWPRNPRVESAEHRLAAATVRVEVLRRDPAAARTALANAGFELPELAEELECLERELLAERSESERVRRLAELGESNAQVRTRMATGMLGAVGAIAVSVYSMMVEARHTITVFDLVTFPMITGTFGVAAVAVSGRELLSHPFNRRAVIWLFGCLAAIIVDRLLALLVGTPPAHVLVHDLAVLTACFALGALWLFRLLAIAALMLFATGVYIALHPSEAHWLFNLSTTLSLVIALFAARQRSNTAES